MPVTHRDPYAPVDHEQSYRGFSPRALVHRARLREIVRLLRSLPLGDTGRLGDFGCSNGFILAELRSRGVPPPGWEFWGFDHASPYVEAARRRGIPGAVFAEFDLDVEDAHLPHEFDLVLCLETLEHTGRYRVGLRNLARATSLGGHLLISVPNELGAHGVVKFFGRKLVRRDVYEGFFRGGPEGPYLRALMTGADLEAFREPPRHGWGEHLGFDLRRFEESLRAELFRGGEFALIRRIKTAAGFGRSYLFRRQA